MLPDAGAEMKGGAGGRISGIAARKNFIAAFQFAALPQIDFNGDGYAVRAICPNAQAVARWDLEQFRGLVKGAVFRPLAPVPKLIPIGGCDT